MTSKKPEKNDLLRLIPNVDEFLNWIDNQSGLSDGDEQDCVPKKIVLQTVRDVLEEQRNKILGGLKFSPQSLEKESLLQSYSALLAVKMRPNLQSVINGTGVVIHTNLGRSVLPSETMTALLQAGGRYSNLELDLSSGKRGSRYSLVEDILCELTGAQAGLVVNNNAAAVLLVLDTLAKDREAIVSRGQLVEIGGSFRIPDVMEKSGAKLVEVGATNRTHLRDYENAISEETSLIMKVHTSNYKIIGFSSEVPLADLVKLGKEHKIPVMEDLGSGCLIDLSKFGLPGEPTVGEVVKSGVDVVTFSGDKLLGGPQAGVIVGEKTIIDKIKQNPLNRALRIDKFTLASLESILRIYYDEQKALKSVPTLSMLSVDPDDLQSRAKKLLKNIKKKIGSKCDISLVKTESKVGGGAMPEHTLASWAVSFSPTDRTVTALEKSLRLAENPVIGRIENENFILDVRTVSDKEIGLLSKCLCHVFEEQK